MGKTIKVKKKCCLSKPPCKKCPIVVLREALKEAKAEEIKKARKKEKKKAKRRSKPPPPASGVVHNIPDQLGTVNGSAYLANSGIVRNARNSITS